LPDTTNLLSEMDLRQRAMIKQTMRSYRFRSWDEVH
jgi:hypothetical protein